MRTLTLFVAMALLAPAGCESDALTGPPELRLGRDQCAECGMLINEDRCSSGAIVEQDGHREVLLFDDIGCQFDHERQPDAPKVIERWVHDYDTRAWVRGDLAHYLRTDQVRTPMNFGTIAFADSQTARTRADELGTAVLDLAGASEGHAREMEAIHGKPGT